jgi:hypothetical protein
VIIFSSVWFLLKKITKPNLKKKNRNWFKLTGFGFGSVFLGQKPVPTCLARFFLFGFGSVLGL